MTKRSTEELLEQLENVLKEKPNYNELPGGSGYRNGYEDGFKLVVKRFKIFRDEILNAQRKG